MSMQPSTPGQDTSVSPDPNQYPDSPSQQLRDSSEAKATTDSAERPRRSLAVDYTGYVPSVQSDSSHRKHALSDPDLSDRAPQRRSSPSIASLLTEQVTPTNENAIDPSLSATAQQTNGAAADKEDRARAKAEKRLQAELMRQKLLALESEIADLDDD